MKRRAPAPAPPPASPAPAAPALAAPTRILLTLAAGVIVLVGLFLARDVLGPLLLGAVIAIICHPVRHPLERRGWPSWAATSAVIAVAYLVLAALAAMLAFAAIQFTRLVVDFAPELRAAADGIMTWLRDVGFERQAADAVASVLDPGSLASLAASTGNAVLSVLMAFFFVLAYVIFMAADGARYARAEARFGSSITGTMQRFRAFNRGVRTYYVVNATFGAIVAIIDGLALWALQVPAPIVWAILAFVTNFIPNIGFVLGLVPPAVLALVVGGWPLMLAVVAIYCVVNVTLQVMIQPKFVSDAVDITLTLSFFSVVFWTLVVGPLGAILAIPLTLLTRALLLEPYPDRRWLRWLSGEDDAAPGAPPARTAGPVSSGRSAGRSATRRS
ncbi:AI-2E family transporter [Microbacterium sp. No. 7]|uniref:AI-2E family transporter n=1 Tax=Microbacterium sp. No. 7 TaxID=1714373 RepID=UPI000AA0B8D1|nr:AI-2E family transporter [Microbacterium sp. No. 7]